MSWVKLEDRAWKVREQGWEAIVVKLPRPHEDQLRAIIYPPQGVDFKIESQRFSTLEEVEESLREFRRLWAQEDHEWREAS